VIVHANGAGAFNREFADGSSARKFSRIVEMFRAAVPNDPAREIASTLTRRFAE
jgi:hypothetical protein